MFAHDDRLPVARMLGWPAVPALDL
jgi:hypothetical protein